MEWDEFLALTEGLVKLSERVGDAWYFQGLKEELGGAYLVRKDRRCGLTSKGTTWSKTYDLEETSVEDCCREDSTVDVGGESLLDEQFWEHHVVYSISYRVPVIYFNAWKSTGELLTLDEIWSEVHESFKLSDSKGLWEVVTQQEHPVLGKPFFQLHPCRTAKFLSSLKEVSGRNVLLPWLSSLGPLVNLSLHPSYAFENSVK